MRRMLAIGLLSLLPPGLVLGQSKKKKAKPASSDSVERVVEKLDDELIGNIKKPDAAFFERTLADDYIAIRADGSVSTKQQTIDLIASDKLKYDSIDMKSRNVRVYGDTVVTTAEADMKGHVGSKDFSGTFRWTRVYVKMKHGQWQLVTFQITKEQ